MQMSANERANIQEQIDEKYRRYNWGSKWWSFAYHCSVFTSAISSAAAALILKLDVFKDVAGKTDYCAVLAALSAILTSISAIGGFHSKWLTNRRSRGRLEEVRIYFSGTNASAEETLRRLTELHQTHEAGILGAEPKAERR